MNTITNTTIDTVKPNGHILVAGFECNATGLTATSSLTEDQWNLAGEQLANVEARLMWYIGDWLIAGEDHGYLPRGRLQDACDRFGISYSTATNAASTCRSVSESSRRRELSYSHHQEIANRDSDLFWFGQTHPEVSRDLIRGGQRYVTLPLHESIQIGLRDPGFTGDGIQTPLTPTDRVTQLVSEAFLVGRRH